MIDLEKLQTAKWYEQDTKEKVITINASQLKEIIQCIEEAKPLILGHTQDAKETYCSGHLEKAWLSKYFP